MVGCLASPAAHAQDAPPPPAPALCPAPPDAPAVASIDPERRLAYLARAFDDEVRDTDLWSWSLGTVFLLGAGTEAVATQGYKNDRDTAIDLTVGAVTFGIGSLSLYLTPLQITSPLRSARSRWSDPDRCAVLARAEHLLVTVEKEEAWETGWFPQVLNGAVNIAASLVIGLGYKHGRQAVISGGSGFALGEANVFTQPRDLRDALAHYRSGVLDHGQPARTVGLSLAPVVSQQVSSVSQIITPKVSGAALRISW